MLRNKSSTSDTMDDVLIEQGGVKGSSTSASVRSINPNHSNISSVESLNFEDLQSIVWRKHQAVRYFQDRDNWWTSSRRTTALKWTLVVITGVIIACIGAFVQVVTLQLNDAKFNLVYSYINIHNNFTNAFFSLLGVSVLLAFVAGLLCCIQPEAAGGGIAEVKAYLNGVNLNRAVKHSVCVSKVLGMCFSCASGLPLGKEGPMIHAGAIVGASVSQGRSNIYGYDTSWSKFQDLRNDRSKRDFVTFGAAAGVAAAFRAPIGGIMFTLEEGASFWSTSITFRAFFCALVTLITVNLILIKSGGSAATKISSAFQFGSFDSFPGYYLYELIIFLLIGAAGGVMGAFFNHVNQRTTIFRMTYVNTTLKKMLELVVITALWACTSFLLPMLWKSTQACTDYPVDTAGWDTQEFNLMDKLVPFGCGVNQYNPLASLLLVDSDTAMLQLFHLREYDGSTEGVFPTGALLVFFIFYFLFATITSGVFAPSGLFIPTLLSGAAFGRLVGHILNCAFPGYVTDAGSYALIGASAMLGGMARMTIAGTVIILEACGNTDYLLPLMLTFAAARYTGNAINEPIYDMQIRIKGLPFLDDSLKSLGFVKYNEVNEIMSQPVVTLCEVNKVETVHRMLSNTSHHGFPVVSKDGHVRGIILRKTLTSLMKLKAFSLPVASVGNSNDPDTIRLAPAATAFHDYMERTYPHYPRIEDIHLSMAEMSQWLDVRLYMESSPYTVNETTSIERSYRFFRTMGLRHLIVLDYDRKVTGILTRKDLTEHRLEEHWFDTGDNMQKYININADGNARATISRANDYSSSGIGNGSDAFTKGYSVSNSVASDDTTAARVTSTPTTTTTATIAGIASNTSTYASAAVNIPITVAIPPPAAAATSSRDRSKKEPKSTKFSN